MNRLEREHARFFHTYKRLPVEVERGEGVYLYTYDGRRYLDMFAGLAVNALGYAHPAVVKAICDQAARYTHLSNYFLQEPQLRLAELLVQYARYQRVFFANSGTESIEGAIKIVRKWGETKGKHDIISFSNSFHGRTMGALSLMDRPRYRNGFGPFLDGCRLVEFNNVDALRNAVTERTAAVLLEFVQGEGGIRPVSPEIAGMLEELRRRHGFLIVGDEIQSGVGRTGMFFAFEHYGVRPDLAVVAKPIGGGLPLGAILADDPIASVLEPGMHGTTFGGNPVACAAGIAVLQEIDSRELMKNAEAIGYLLAEGFRKLQKEFPSLIREVRGMGLMLGIELSVEGEPFVVAMREKGILINCTDQTVLRFLPPLIITETHVGETLDALREVFRRQN
jgi:predicted acetylornithine/succinylornithine family transaminase